MRVCNVEGCDRKHDAKGLCKNHYKRLKRFGSTAVPYKPTLEERFNMGYMPIPETGCWIWLCDSGRGYGAMYANGKTQRAHRVSWEIHNGPIPKGGFICHKCDEPACVNPEHLFIGTPQTNMDDMMIKGRHRTNPYKGKRKRDKINGRFIMEVEG